MKYLFEAINIDALFNRFGQTQNSWTKNKTRIAFLLGTKAILTHLLIN